MQLGAYAVECRINARSAGRVTQFMTPGGFGVRMDTFLYAGYNVPPWYDHLVAKLIVTGRTRAGGRCGGCSGRCRSWSSRESRRTSNRRRRSSRIPVFRSGEYGTGFLGEILKEGGL